MIGPCAGWPARCGSTPRALRTELTAAGHRFFSDGDTEVVVRAYAQWGPDFARHLIGTFAVAIAERDSERVVLARDRHG